VIGAHGLETITHVGQHDRLAARFQIMKQIFVMKIRSPATPIGYVVAGDMHRYDDVFDDMLRSSQRRRQSAYVTVAATRFSFQMPATAALSTG
jgi:hypothetical protein